ncbi:MAG: GNAT family protein [Herpetosiphon sp.]
MQFHIGAMTLEAATEIARWHYTAPYDQYDPPANAFEASINALLEPSNRYVSLVDDEARLVGFACFGEEAQVAGGDYRNGDALDVGFGLRPELTGQGHGSSMLAAIMAHCWEGAAAPRRLRLTVAAWNERAIRVYSRAGFVAQQTFRRLGDENRLFVVMTRERGEPVAQSQPAAGRSTV